MIIKTYIERDLKRLNRLYNDSMATLSPEEPIYYSKLAVLEFSGWVEESFDSIALRSVKNELKTAKFQKLMKDVIKSNSGFTYDNNFMPMLSKIVGLPTCEKLHEELEIDGSISILSLNLTECWEQRRKAAHVNLANTTISFDAPSVSLGRLLKVYPILRRLYSWFCVPQLTPHDDPQNTESHQA